MINHLTSEKQNQKENKNRGGRLVEERGGGSPEISSPDSSHRRCRQQCKFQMISLTDWELILYEVVWFCFLQWYNESQRTNAERGPVYSTKTGIDYSPVKLFIRQGQE